MFQEYKQHGRGIVGRLAVELSRAEGLDFWIVNIDHGVGLLRKSESEYSIPDLSSEY